MSLFVFFSVLGAALLHAMWNAVIKSGVAKMRGMLIMTLVQGGVGGLILCTQPLPEGEVWLWLLASGVFHSGYKLFLAFAYENGDLSRVYPIARGAAPMLVLGVGAVILADQITTFEYLGVLLLGVGIAMMAAGALARREDRRLIPLALGSAAMTAGYSLVDGMGARVSGNATAYVAWLFVFDAVLFTPIAIALKGRALTGASLRDWCYGGLAAAASYGAYAIAVWAMTQAPIALVAALRETSILFAVTIGWLAFGERMDAVKGAAAVLIVGGVVLTRI
ncbi:DMT family transporter [Sulfitobacter sabulilitoris]|uniref:Peptide ABC transporter permease n=1 Tax=Sulfitobacter sabulilitoris TaxID=2562655 RepID=A0A5S3PLF1_9RHOB|nr:DMT family transporter [Sulfitobacter sabulilitoris]TMM55264.1 peptide ABC transporter permease [Sulfitobacter sabulilitoris]